MSKTFKEIVKKNFNTKTKVNFCFNIIVQNLKL